jgi:hypothetical protein
MKFKVYQAKEMPQSFTPAPETFNKDDFVMVAEVETEDIEGVFRLTNHIDHDWTTNPEVSGVTGSCRSTSVGDIIEDEDGKLMYCASFGWEEIVRSEVNAG